MVLKVSVSRDLIGDDVEQGYGKVADASFFAGGRQIRGAIAVYRDGAKVIGLWGGYRNSVTREPWEHDTVVNMFSTTKGVGALPSRWRRRGELSFD